MAGANHAHDAEVRATRYGALVQCTHCRWMSHYIAEPTGVDVSRAVREVFKHEWTAHGIDAAEVSVGYR